MESEKKNERFRELLGDEIRSHREGLKRSLDQVAQDSETGISKSSLSLMENGTQQVGSGQLFELSRILHFSVDEVFNRIEKNINTEEYSDIGKYL